MIVYNMTRRNKKMPNPCKDVYKRQVLNNANDVVRFWAPRAKRSTAPVRGHKSKTKRPPGEQLLDKCNCIDVCIKTHIANVLKVFIKSTSRN